MAVIVFYSHGFKFYLTMISISLSYFIAIFFIKNNSFPMSVDIQSRYNSSFFDLYMSYL